VYLSLALIIVIVARPSFERKPVAAILEAVETDRTRQPLAQK